MEVLSDMDSMHGWEHDPETSMLLNLVEKAYWKMSGELIFLQLAIF